MIFRRFTSAYRTFRERCDRVLSMNGRNLEYIYPSNARVHFQLADNKLLAKKLLTDCDLPVAKTFHAFSYFYELSDLADKLSGYESFVIKPAQGSGGNGIIVLTRCDKKQWRTPGGTVYDIEAIKKHISDIIFGVFSFDMSDTAIIEEKIEQHPFINQISPLGLADLRIILYRYQPVMAMMRIATSQSGGKANLHQGGIGIGIAIDKGITTQAMCARERFTHHPDNGSPLLDLEVPYWSDILDIARKTAQNVPLQYLGIDIAMSINGPVILEFNARPGIEIQNVNDLGLVPPLECITKAGA